jgi:predicted  nucleic acid-binding Zn-ribbon protein
MTLADIHRSLTQLLYRHPLADTNVDAIECAGTNAEFVTDNTEIERLNDELEDREREIEGLEEKILSLHSAIDELKDELREARKPK